MLRKIRLSENGWRRVYGVMSILSCVIFLFVFTQCGGAGGGGKRGLASLSRGEFDTLTRPPFNNSTSTPTVPGMADDPDPVTTGGASTGTVTTGGSTTGTVTTGGSTTGTATTGGSTTGTATTGGSTTGTATTGGSTTGTVTTGGSTTGTATTGGSTTGTATTGGSTTGTTTSGYSTGTTSGGSTSGGFNENDDLGDSLNPVNPFKTETSSFTFDENVELAQLESTEAKVAYAQKVAEQFDVSLSESEVLSFKSTYDLEKAVVEKAVVARIEAIKDGESLPLLIPVGLVFTTGSSNDAQAQLSYSQSVLKDSPTAEAIIQTGNPNVAYVVNAAPAANNFLNGEMKYISLVEVQSVTNQNPDVTYEAFRQKNSLTNSPAEIFQAHQETGLPQVNGNYIAYYDSTGTTPKASLVLADFRNANVPALSSIPLTNSAPATRTIVKQLKDTFNLQTFVQKRNEVLSAYSFDRTVNGFTYKAYRGMTKMLDRFDRDTVPGKITTSMHAPIVMDLGSPNIQTSSERNGSHFNLSNGKTYINGVVQDPVTQSYTHKTAWVGGSLKLIDNPLGTSYPQIWSRVAEDGFLVLPKNGTIITSEQMFSSAFVNTRFPTKRYNDGFEALMEYFGSTTACQTDVSKIADKNEKRRVLKARYIGPWTRAYKDLKIWVDANRNGKSEAKEIMDLGTAGVMAINTCVMTDLQTHEYDEYGNMTKKKTTFLYDKNFMMKIMASMLNETTLDIIESGINYDGNPAMFRLQADVYFRNELSDFLEPSLASRSKALNKTVEVKVGNTPVDEAKPLWAP